MDNWISIAYAGSTVMDSAILRGNTGSVQITTGVSFSLIAYKKLTPHYIRHTSNLTSSVTRCPSSVLEYVQSDLRASWCTDVEMRLSLHNSRLYVNSKSTNFHPILTKSAEHICGHELSAKFNNQPIARSYSKYGPLVIELSTFQLE